MNHILIASNNYIITLLIRCAVLVKFNYHKNHDFYFIEEKKIGNIFFYYSESLENEYFFRFSPEYVEK